MFDLFKNKHLLQAQKEHDQAISNSSLETNIGMLTNVLCELIKQQQGNDNLIKQLVNSLNNLNKLAIDGKHICFLYGQALEITFKDKKLINIEIV